MRDLVVVVGLVEEDVLAVLDALVVEGDLLENAGRTDAVLAAQLLPDSSPAAFNPDEFIHPSGVVDQSVLEQASQIKEIAKRGKDPLAGPLRLGVIYTIGPYLLPSLVRQAISKTPQMPLMLQENFTVKLLEMLRTGEIDCAIMAEPFPDTGLATALLYDEPFMAAVPSTHPLATQATVTADALLLGGTNRSISVNVSDVTVSRVQTTAFGIEAFNAEVERYGAWKSDIRDFIATVNRSN